MNGIRTDYRKMRDGRVNEWESILGRLDAVGEEINRALRRSTGMESRLFNPHRMSKQRHLAVMAGTVR